MSFSKSLQVLLLFLVALVAVQCGWAQTYTVLYSFTGGADGASPKSSLVLDPSGNLYGTTIGINPYPNLQTTGSTAGSVFKISAGGIFTLLNNFGTGGANGASPSGGLVRDASGNLYGATSGGGASTNPECFEGGTHPSLPLDGCGEVFKVDANGNFSVFFSFSGQSLCRLGCWPLAPLTLDTAGNLYGTTFLGGSRNCDTFKLNLLGGQLNSDCGVIFKINPQGMGTLLHGFGDARRDGDFPNPGLIVDAAGNLYGTAFGGGINTNGGNGGAGTIFKLGPTGNETVLFHFEEFVNDMNPNGTLIRDGAGNFYGTSQDGAAFKLDPKGNFTRLAGLRGNPLGGLTVDAAGNVYGTTFDGGNPAPTCQYLGNGDCGTVFKLDASGNFTVVYNFSGGTDGDAPYAGLIMDAAGNLYGTAAYGGTVNANCPVGCGVVFKITP